MKVSTKTLWRSVVLLGGVALLGGCVTTTEPLGTTTDGIQSAVGTVTDLTSSTTPSDSDKKAFVNDRFEAIRFDAAKGEGENIETLAALYGESDRKRFARWMQANYARFFTDLREPSELVVRIDRLRGANG